MPVIFTAVLASGVSVYVVVFCLLSSDSLFLRIAGFSSLTDCSCVQRSTYGGGFFLTCDDFGRMFEHSFPACTFFYIKVEISSHTLIPLFRPGSVHSGSAS